MQRKQRYFILPVFPLIYFPVCILHMIDSMQHFFILLVHDTPQNTFKGELFGFVFEKPSSFKNLVNLFFFIS